MVNTSKSRVEQGARKIWEPSVTAFPHTGRVCQTFINGSTYVPAASMMSFIAKITLCASLVYLDVFVTNSTRGLCRSRVLMDISAYTKERKKYFVVVTFLYEPLRPGFDLVLYYG